MIGENAEDGLVLVLHHAFGTIAGSRKVVRRMPFRRSVDG